MKRALIVLIALVLIAGGIAYYFLLPAPSPVPAETQAFLAEECVEQAAQYSEFAQAVASGDTGACDQLSLVKKPLCVAAITQDPAMCETAEEDLQEQCRALAARQPGCDKGFSRFSCEAAARGDIAYFDSGKAKKDCDQLVRYEAALESRDRRNCEEINHPVLKEECVSALAG